MRFDAVVSESSDGAPHRKKRRRVVRPGGEKVTESEAVASFRLSEDSPDGGRDTGTDGVSSAQRSSPAPPLTGNDARLLEDVPPHWGKR
jgi:hypothetical protein